MAIIGFKLRKVREGLWIKSELKIIGFLAMVAILATAPPYVIPGFSYPKFVQETMWAVFMQLLIFMESGYPVYLSYRSRLTGDLSSVREVPHDFKHARDTTRELQLVEILHDVDHAESLESFKEHLISEINVESLLFYFAVHELKELTGYGLKSSTEVNIEIEVSSNAEVSRSQSVEATSVDRSSGAPTKDGGNDCGEKRVTFEAAEPEKHESHSEVNATLVAQMALEIFMEFVADGSPSQVRLDELHISFLKCIFWGDTQPLHIGIHTFLQ